MINLTVTAEAIQALIEGVLPTIAIYWSAAQVPASGVPSEFVIIEPLFATVNQSWATNTHARHSVQVRACATTVGRATELAAVIQAALPPETYETPYAGPLIKVGHHYDMLLEAITHAVEG